MRHSRRWLWAGAVGAYGLGVGAWLLLAPSSPSSAPALTDEERVRRFGQLAAEYDRRIEGSEERMGLEQHRADVVGRAHGRVLEVGAGTCRNLMHYSPAVTSLVLADAAPEMLVQCREKLHGAQQSGRRQRLPGDVRTEVARAEALPFSAGEFDAVVDTFSLCSVADVDAALREMRRVVKASPDARVLLLEHGRSPHWAVNVYLDALAAWHARRWGCWWNRPLAAAVERAGLEVLEMRRAHFGTTLVVVARPRLGPSLPAAVPHEADRRAA